MKVKIRNYQSLKKAEIDIDGLTVITGKTNGGKTAVVRALEEALFNRGDDSHVRAGTDESEVTISDNDQTMTYRRSQKRKSEKTSYQINGSDEIRKVGRDQLPEVAEMFRITDVKLSNGHHAVLNFWKQNDRPFLMDKTPSQLYEFLSLSGTKQYTDVLRRMKKDARDIRTEVIAESRVLEEMRKTQSEKNAFLRSQEGFDRLFDEIKEIDSKDQKNAQMAEISSEYDRLVKASEKKEEEISSLPVLPEIDISSVIACENMQLKHEKEMKETDAAQKAMKDAEEELKALIIFPEQDIDDLREKFSRLKSHMKAFDELNLLENTIRKAKTQLENMADYPEMDCSIVADKEKALLEKEKELELVEQLGRQAESIRRAYAAAQIEAQRASAELNEFEKKIGICPLCGRPFGKNHNIEEETENL